MSHVSFRTCALGTNPEATEFSMFTVEVESFYIFLRDMPHVSFRECVLVVNVEAMEFLMFMVEVESSYVFL